MDSGLAWPVSSEISSGRKSSWWVWMTVLRPLKFVYLPSREAMNAILYLYQLEPSCTKHWILCCQLDSGRICFGFPRQKLLFSFPPSFLPFCFFFNAFSRTLECEWFPLFSKKNIFQFKIWQTFIFCKFVHFQGDIFEARVTFLVSR